jgi:uncharacterized protein YpmB
MINIMIIIIIIIIIIVMDVLFFSVQATTQDDEARVDGAAGRPGDTDMGQVLLRVKESRG